MHNLASEFKTNVGEINKKIRVLRSKFFQMYKKMYEDCCKNGIASAFVTKWEYYRPLQFILVARENIENITEHSVVIITTYYTIFVYNTQAIFCVNSTVIKIY